MSPAETAEEDAGSPVRLADRRHALHLQVVVLSGEQGHPRTFGVAGVLKPQAWRAPRQWAVITAQAHRCPEVELVYNPARTGAASETEATVTVSQEQAPEPPGRYREVSRRSLPDADGRMDPVGRPVGAQDRGAPGTGRGYLIPGRVTVIRREK